MPFVESIRATLAGDRAALEHYFAVGCDGDLAHWTLHLVPKEASLARSVRGSAHQRRTRCDPGGRDPPERRRPLTAHDRARKSRHDPPRPRGHGGIHGLAAARGAARHAHPLHHRSLRLPAPGAPSASQRVLIEQLREGPAARLIIAAIGGGDAAARAQSRPPVAQGLRADPRFAIGQQRDAQGLQADREFLFRHRYLLSEAVTPQRFTASGLHEAIASSLDALAAPEALLLKELFAQDPTGSCSRSSMPWDPSARRARRGACGARATARWRSPSCRPAPRGRIRMRSRAACEAVRQASARARHAAGAQRAAVTLRLTGPPVFAVAARVLIKHEVMRLSLLSAVLITRAAAVRVPLVVPALLLGLVPVASGALAGIAAVALGFGAVHGITLGFGVTLIGEAVDYSIYLFVQRGSTGAAPVWPTIRLGVLTSICRLRRAPALGFSGAGAARAVLHCRSDGGRPSSPASCCRTGCPPALRSATCAQREQRCSGHSCGCGRRVCALWGVPLSPGRSSTCTAAHPEPMNCPP